jgi:uncharacterized protein (DUF58 family)
MLKAVIKKWAFLFLIIIFNLIIGLRTSVGFFYFFFWFLLSAVAISFCWVVFEYMAADLTLSRKIVGKIEEDDILKVETLARNKGIIPLFNFVLIDRLACALPQEREKRILLESLWPGASLSLKYSCLCPQRGRYDLGPLTVYFFDPLGLFFLKRTYPLYSGLYVYPKAFRIQRFPALVKGILPWFGIETTRFSGDEDEFYGIREYKEGDPIKIIHWLSSARKNTLIVKQFQRQSFSRATIMFNLEKNKNFGEGKESIAEYTVKIAASVAKYLTENDISLEIIAHAGEIAHLPFNKGHEHLEDIFRFLAVCRAESYISLGEIFEEFSRYIPDDSNLIVIMPDTDWEYLPSMLSLEKRSVSLIPLILISSTFLYAGSKEEAAREAKIKLARAFNFNPILISCGDNLEEPFLKIQ